MYDCLVVCGPTASGKSALGVELALALDGEVICADSMQIYRGMDIGTAKTTPAEARGVPHHMMDIADPSESFSAARWATMADRCVAEIRSRGRLPIVVGGTGLYIEALLRGTDFAAAPTDDTLRPGLEREYDTLGGDAFRAKLAAVDPERAALLAPGDKKRLVRAMEVWLVTGRTITEHDRQSRLQPPRYRAVQVMPVFADRRTLYDRIDRRADRMFDAGLVEEVRALLDAGLDAGCTAMQAIGYRQTAEYLAGRCTLEDARDAVRRASRRYAKRQLTWFHHVPQLHEILWSEPPEPAAAARAVTALLRG